MPTVFTRIIEGELPGHFVYEDEHCVGFLTIEPLREGHVLMVPREEVDHWLDLSPQLLTNLMAASQRVGRAIHEEFGSQKVGMMIVGLEVDHVHIHLSPIDSIREMDFSRTAPADQDRLANVAARLQAALARQAS
ncbi:MAG: HIT family protein [Thermoleophilia bacterium]|nr:HIT family protein [Thermoleophilia bacterium]MDH3724157.1 HIT family protein [Thermoleophilia bacterium]